MGVVLGLRMVVKVVEKTVMMVVLRMVVMVVFWGKGGRGVTESVELMGLVQVVVAWMAG